MEDMKEEEETLQVTMHEEDHRPQNNSRYSRYESNVANQSEYILISALTSSTPLDSWDSWLVDSGATHQFSGYKEVFSNLVERESNLKIILGDNSTHPTKVLDPSNFI